MVILLAFCGSAGIAVVGMLRAMLNGMMLLILVQLQRHGYTFRITFYWNAVQKLMALEKRVSELALVTTLYEDQGNCMMKSYSAGPQAYMRLQGSSLISRDNNIGD